MERPKAKMLRRGGAFTLIELLVVIAIIALLVSILLPALAQAKATGRMIREQSATRQFSTGWLSYANDYRGSVLIPYVHWTHAHPSAGPIQMRPQDSWTDSTKTIEGDVVKTWPLRLSYYTDFEMDGLQIDKQTLNLFRSRTHLPSGTTGTTTSYDNTQSYQYAIATHPSIGLNSVYVGGHYRLGAFPNGNATIIGHPRGSQGGHFYISTIDEIFNPAILMVGATARATDIASVTRGSNDYGGRHVGQSANLNVNVVPGHHMVTPPNIGFPTNGGSAPAWINAPSFDKTKPAWAYGGVDFRHFDKAVAAIADGHVATFTVTQMRDMRIWSNYATSANWTFTRGPGGG
ncbi:MAG: type II secretion system protein [Phycisphaeraceae bacterium]|nr:type II secretion system protein [Phycisphaeraceae bacterium]